MRLEGRLRVADGRSQLIDDIGQLFREKLCSGSLAWRQDMTRTNYQGLSDIME